MDRKRNHLPRTLVAVLTAAAIFEVYYFGFQLPGEEARAKREIEELTAKQRKEQAALAEQVPAKSVGSQIEDENK
jgi:hypothetical protein